MKYLFLLIRIVGGFWLFIGVCYLVGGYYVFALIEIIAGLFFIFLPTIIRKIKKSKN